MGTDIYSRQTSVLKTNNGDIFVLFIRFVHRFECRLSNALMCQILPTSRLICLPNVWIKFEAGQHSGNKCCISANVSYKFPVTQRRSYKCPHEIGSVRSCCSDYLQGQSQGFPYIHLFVAAHHHIENWQPHIDFPSMPYLINLLIITHALQWNREPDVTSNLLLWRTAAV